MISDSFPLTHGVHDGSDAMNMRLYTKINPLGPTGKIIASLNIGILETHWRRFCHMESEAVDCSYLLNFFTGSCQPMGVFVWCKW